jgi:type I restriction enzyme S subunit
VSGWKTFRIGDLVEPVKSWNPLRSDLDDTFQYVDLSAVDQSLKRIVGAREVPCAEAPSRAKQLIKANDVLVSTVRPNLNGVAQVEQELDGSTASTGFCVLRPRASLLSSSYLFHWVKTEQFIADMVRKATGASYPAVSDKTILESTIAAPPIAEQRRIAAILDQADALRAKRREALAQLGSLTQSIFIEMFGDPVTNPKGWPIASLHELMDASGPQNGLYKPSSDYGTGTPILRIDAFYDGKVTKLDILKRVRLSDTELNLYGLREDDIVINRVNSIEYLGKSALIPPLSETTVFESNMMRFTLRRGVVNPIYVVQFLQTKFIKNQILSCSKNAVNQSSINQQDVKGFQVHVPPLHLQQAFATRIQSVEALKVTQNAGLQELDRLFASLQHRAFPGELYMRPSLALRTHREAIRAIALRHRVTNVRVFGSVVHGDDTDDSDLDLLVEPTKETTMMDIAKIQLELSQLLPVAVDVLTPNGLPAKFRGQVVAEALAV